MGNIKEEIYIEKQVMNKIFKLLPILCFPFNFNLNRFGGLKSKSYILLCIDLLYYIYSLHPLIIKNVAKLRKSRTI